MDVVRDGRVCGLGNQMKLPRDFVEVFDCWQLISAQIAHNETGSCQTGGASVNRPSEGQKNEFFY